MHGTSTYVQASDLEMQLLRMRQQLAKCSMGDSSNSSAHGDDAGWRVSGYGSNDNGASTGFDPPRPVSVSSSVVGK